mmetsp:Transcript_112943/g.224849  ORF Transcript_112943/g.224849 Transcript_112943/m.224849 type:complete len:107 (+) Transcript_112943:1217-1537(+)
MKGSLECKKGSAVVDAAEPAPVTRRCKSLGGRIGCDGQRVSSGNMGSSDVLCTKTLHSSPDFSGFSRHSLETNEHYHTSKATTSHSSHSPLTVRLLLLPSLKKGEP